jgi:glutamine synthetase type III
LLALTIELQNILVTVFEQLLTARIEGAVASGTYDVGLETLRAESFVVTDRRTTYVHAGTGAELDSSRSPSASVLAETRPLEPARVAENMPRPVLTTDTHER